MTFEKYPFEKLSILLEGLESNKAYTSSVLTIGEPQFKTPQFIQNALKNSTELLNKYPKSSGESYLKEAMINFNKKRFNIELLMEEIIPVLGTKEVLFNFPQFYLSTKNKPTMAFTNPFYKIYEGAAIASRAKIIHLDLLEENNFLPIMNDEELKKCDLVILNFPNNPTCAMMSQNELEKWVKKALEFDFVLINDECYSEIYFDDNKKPVSLLEASISAGNKEFKNVLVLNSISKRSSAPGLRDGFIAGDKDILKDYALYRTYSGCAIPVPLQKASAAAWNDEEHVIEFRHKYKENFKLVKEILGIDMPDATFYVWLKVKDDLRFTKELFVQKNIKVLPGTFLGANGIGADYIRIALVEDASKTREVLTRLKEFMETYK
jgi:aspartate/methionine/tyrosine aminotransferase